MIGLATAVFPSKIKGNCLDSFARKHLWDVGLDYLHGTGHGVGAFLNVHEGPMGISWRVYPNDPGTSDGLGTVNKFCLKWFVVTVSNVVTFVCVLYCRAAGWYDPV